MSAETFPLHESPLSFFYSLPSLFLPFFSHWSVRLDLAHFTLLPYIILRMMNCSEVWPNQWRIKAANSGPGEKTYFGSLMSTFLTYEPSVSPVARLRLGLCELIRPSLWAALANAQSERRSVLDDVVKYSGECWRRDGMREPPTFPFILLFCLKWAGRKPTREAHWAQRQSSSVRTRPEWSNRSMVLLLRDASVFAVCDECRWDHTTNVIQPRICDYALRSSQIAHFTNFFFVGFHVAPELIANAVGVTPK